MASEAIPQKELWPHSNVCGLKNGQYADSRLLPNISGGGSTINVLKEDPPSLSRSYMSIVNGLNISNVPNVPFWEAKWWPATCWSALLPRVCNRLQFCQVLSSNNFSILNRCISLSAPQTCIATDGLLFPTPIPKCRFILAVHYIFYDPFKKTTSIAKEAT